MKSTTIEAVSEIIDTFNIEEISGLLERQIEMDENGMNESKTDYFHPIYLKYRSIIDSEETSEECKLDAENRFRIVCDLFLDKLLGKFHITLDNDWKEDHRNEIPALVTAIYCFFVKDLISNLQEVLINYINQNRKAIYDVFEERKTKKDASTLVNKRNFSIDLAVILSNIYDTSSYILKQLSEEEFLEYMNPDYGPKTIIEDLMQDGTLEGDFMEVIEEIYENCIGVKGGVCFNILSSYQVVSK